MKGIKQILPADRWQASFQGTEEAEPTAFPLVCWALVESIHFGNANQRLRGIILVPDNDRPGFADEQPGFSGYFMTR